MCKTHRRGDSGDKRGKVKLALPLKSGGARGIIIQKADRGCLPGRGKYEISQGII